MSSSSEFVCCCEAALDASAMAGKMQSRMTKRQRSGIEVPEPEPELFLFAEAIVKVYNLALEEDSTVSRSEFVSK